MLLDVFAHKLGDEALPRLSEDNTGIIAVKMLDAIQTVVNVLTDNDGGKGWTVGFDPTVNAYTDRSARRQIVVSVKPLLDAKPGTPLAKVAAIMTGFAVHEVGHTKLDFYTLVDAEWPGKQLPKVITNIIEDVVLEMQTVRQFPGFADNGEGNVFRPTLEWVAKQTSPTTPLEWDGSTGHKVNVMGQIVRYRDFVTFNESDAATRDALNFVENWMTGITADLTPKGCVELVREMLAYMKATMPDEAPPPPIEPPDFPSGGGQSIPQEDDETEPTEGDDQPGEGGDDDGEPGDGDGDGGDGEAEDGDDEGGTEGGGDSDDADGDGEADGDGDGEGEDGTGDGDGTGEGKAADGNDADHAGRTEADKGANDGTGKGGSGQAVADASDEGDPDAGFDETELTESFDALSGNDTYDQHRVARAEADERVTTRVDAGAYGTMRVIFR